MKVVSSAKLALAAALSLALAGCNGWKEDFDTLTQKYNELQKEVAALKSSTVTKTEFENLQTLVNTLNGKDWIEAVTPVTGGYKIKFAKGGEKEILNGKDGAKGITPQMRVNSETGEWEVSSDEGKTWTSTDVVAQGVKGDKGDKGDKGETGDAFFKSVVLAPDGNSITITLASGDFFILPVVGNELAAETWTVKATTEAGGEAALFDADPSTVFTSNAPDSTAVIELDLASTRILTGLRLLQSASKNSKEFKVEAGTKADNAVEVFKGKAEANAFTQEFPFNEKVVAKFVRITILNTYDAAKPAELADLQLFNESEQYPAKSFDAPIFTGIVNGKKPYKHHLITVQSMGNRFGQMDGWKHSDPTNLSFDSADNSFVLWSAAPWGIPDPQNAKLWQTLDLLPGSYELKVDMWKTSNTKMVDAFIAIAKGESLPDFAKVKEESLASEDAVSGMPKIVTLSLEVSERGKFSFGFVYNLHNIYNAQTFPWPWCDLYINSVELVIK